MSTIHTKNKIVRGTATSIADVEKSMPEKLLCGFALVIMGQNYGYYNNVFASPRLKAYSDGDSETMKLSDSMISSLRLNITKDGLLMPVFDKNKVYIYAT